MWIRYLGPAGFLPPSISLHRLPLPYYGIRAIDCIEALGSRLTHGGHEGRSVLCFYRSHSVFNDMRDKVRTGLLVYVGAKIAFRKLFSTLQSFINYQSNLSADLDILEYYFNDLQLRR